MELQPNQSFFLRMCSAITNKDYYKTSSGVKVVTEKDFGTVQLSDDNTVKIYNAKKVSVYGTKGDDKIYVANSQVYAIKPGKGDNKTFLDNCTYKKYNKFWGTGSYIMTGGGEFSSYKKGSDIVKINGDFNGIIYAQQGAGKAYGNDKKAHKDIILINGNNNGYINIDTHDSVKISGKEKGKIINQSIIYF